MNAKQTKMIEKYGVDLARRAAEMARRGEGAATVGATLGVHWKTAGALMDVGEFIATAERIKIETAIGAYARHSLRAASAIAEARAARASAKAKYTHARAATKAKYFHAMPVAWVADQKYAAMVAARAARDSARTALSFAYAAEAAFGGGERVADCLRLEEEANAIMAGE